MVTSPALSDTTPLAKASLSASELQRRGELLLRLVHVMGALVLFAFGGSLLEPKNSKLVSVVFYSVTGLGIWIVAKLTRRGHVVLAAWILCSFFWTVIA
ncbi:MAG TPA: hypothetical protein VNW92_22795, partial [Polyangiaceae bacterium]|nr:hypothetical protein [Polyangiaceae bacterium]